MGKIPQYEQGQLASKAVGTPGLNLSQVNTSGIELANTLNRAVSGVQQEVDATLQAQRLETQRALRAKEAEAKAAAKELENAQQAAQVGKYVSDYRMRASEREDGLRAQHEWDTAGAMDELKTGSQKDTDDTLNSIQDPLLKARTQTALQEENAARASTFSNWVETRRIPITLGNLTGIEGNLKQSLSDSGKSWEDVHRETEQYLKENAATYGVAHGPDAAQAKMYNVRSDALKKRLQDVSIKNPTKLEAEISHFGGAIDPADAEPFLAEQRQVAAAKLRDIEDTRKAQVSTTAITAMDTRANLNTADFNSVSDNVKTQQQIYDDMAAHPEIYKPADIAAQLGRVKEAKNIQKSFGKEQTSAERQAELAKMRSPKARENRINLINIQNKIRANPAFAKDTASKQKALEKYTKAVEASHNAGFVDDKEYGKLTGWAAGQQEKINNKKPKKSFNSPIMKLWENGQKLIKQVHPVKKSDAGMPTVEAAYTNSLFEMAERYSALNNIEEDDIPEYTAQRMHEMAIASTLGMENG